MPASKQNNALRIILPAAIMGIIGFGLVFFGLQQQGSTPTETEQAAATETEAQLQTTAADEIASEPAGAAASEPATPVTQPLETANTNVGTQAELQAAQAQQAPAQTTAPLATFQGLRARPQPIVSDDTLTALGSLDPASGFRAKVSFTAAGAGVRSIGLSNYYDTVADEIAAAGNPGEASGHYILQEDVPFILPSPLVNLTTGEVITSEYSVVSLGARSVEINGSYVDLFSGAPRWRETAPGAFICEIEDGEGALVATVTRAYELTENSYELKVRQQLTNHTDQTLNIRWRQFGPTDLKPDISGYRLDTRRIRVGHLFAPNRDPGQQLISDAGDDGLVARTSTIKAARDNAKNFVGTTQVWPNVDEFGDTGQLVWLAQTSRYFAFAIHPLIEDDQIAAAQQGQRIDKSFPLASRVFGMAYFGGSTEKNTVDDGNRLLTLTESDVRTAAPEGSVDLSFGVYAGPKDRDQLSGKEDPVYDILSLEQLVVYNIGGMCAFCTFQWLAGILISILDFYHSFTFDWAIATILLVCTVRLMLHPLTKKGQISMGRFGKQMQKLQPKQQKIREKYKDDTAKQQQEMARLMREEGINPAGLLGCMPMFLQTPIFIALYAMLYFAFEIRHEAAFFGVFQSITGGAWQFMGDLSSPDRFIDFGSGFTVPLMGEIRSINILPLLYGAIFFVHQKYITPPQTGSMSPEQQQMQKIMQRMMPIMMPIFLYNAPAGLSVYFITNSVIAIFESKHVRSHIDSIDFEAEKKKKNASGKKGFMERMAERVAEAQAIQEQRMQQKQQGGAGRKNVQSRTTGSRKPKKK